MRKEINKMNFHWRSFLFFISIFVLFWLIFQIFFAYEDCRNRECFNDNLKDCDRAKFVSGNDMIFEYVIKGKSGNSCEVVVELLQGELNNADSKKLEGKKMICMLPIGVIMNPESDIGICHGILKEGLQDLVIKKLHTYLIQNLGKLNLEIAGLPKN